MNWLMSAGQPFSVWNATTRTKKSSGSPLLYRVLSALTHLISICIHYRQGVTLCLMSDAKAHVHLHSTVYAMAFFVLSLLFVVDALCTKNKRLNVGKKLHQVLEGDIWCVWLLFTGKLIERRRLLHSSASSLASFKWQTFPTFLAPRRGCKNGSKKVCWLCMSINFLVAGLVCRWLAVAFCGCGEAGRHILRVKLSFKEFWGVQFEKGCFLFRLQRVFGQWRNSSWGSFSASNLYPRASLWGRNF